GFDYAGLAQNPSSVGGVDVDTHRLALNYRYAIPENVYGVEFNYYDRNPDAGEDTDAYRLSLFWTHEFDRPPHAAASAGLLSYSDESQTLPAGPLLLVALAPGLDIPKLKQSLELAGTRGGTQQPGLIVYETHVLAAIDQRQRLALLHDGDMLRSSALIIDFDDVGDRDNAAQTFERVRKSMIDAYGSPTFSFETGEFGTNLADDIAAGRLIRVVEWTTDKGKLRLGIPKRLDGQIRMEIQHAPSFGPPRDTLWSVEGVR
ncbi:MAG: hypothetical protein ACREUA_04750, partial [Burkholderiales bacterium]